MHSSLRARITLALALSLSPAGCGTNSPASVTADAGADSSPADAAHDDAQGTDASALDGSPVLDAASLADSSLSADAGSLFTTLRLQNSLCLPRTLPMDAADCEILIGVPGSCNASDGLSPASAAQVAQVDAVFPSNQAPSGSVCVLAHLPSAPAPGVGCGDQQMSGWCYVHGSCLADAGTHACQQALCTTTEFSGTVGAVNEAGVEDDLWGLWLTCP